MSSDKCGLDCNKGSNKFETVAGPDQNVTLNPNMSIKGHTTAEDKEGFKVSQHIMSPKYCGSKEVENHNTKLDESTHEAKVYSNMRSNNSCTPVEPNKTTKPSETNNKPAAMKEDTNYIATTLKTPGTVVTKDKRKG